MDTKVNIGRYIAMKTAKSRMMKSCESVLLFVANCVSQLRFDDLTFLSTGLTRFPLEGYKEKCSTQTVLGSRYPENPLVIDTPIYITGMSYGALSANAKTALGKAARMVGTASCTGDGGMLDSEREESSKLIYQVLPSRYGFNPHHLSEAQAIEIVVGQGAKPGTGGMLMGVKVLDEISEMRDKPCFLKSPSKFAT